MKEDERVIIIADSQGRGFGFAKEVYNYLLSKGQRGFIVELTDILKTKFRDGEFKVRIKDNVRRGKCFFIHDANKNPCEWLAELVFVLEAMSFSSPAEINVVLPYTKFARQDRKDESRVSVNTKALADVISHYADRGMTVDLHAPQIQEYFSIPFDNLYSFPVLISYLVRNCPSILNNLVLVSPDAGGAKRVESLQKRLSKIGIGAEMGICYKKRQKENEVEEIKIMGDVAGKNCIIVDDIIDTGATFEKTAKVLKEKGANQVYAYAAHGIFSEGFDKFKAIDKLIVTDSLSNEKNEKLEIVPLAELFGEAIYRTIVGESLSRLFN